MLLPSISYMTYMWQARLGLHAMTNWAMLMCRLFGLPIALALTAGFIQSAISPTVLVTGMLELQRRGYGQGKSVSS